MIVNLRAHILIGHIFLCLLQLFFHVASDLRFHTMSLKPFFSELLRQKAVCEIAILRDDATLTSRQAAEFSKHSKFERSKHKHGPNETISKSESRFQPNLLSDGSSSPPISPTRQDSLEDSLLCAEAPMRQASFQRTGGTLR